MKRTKLLLALVAVVVLCLSLAACDSHTHTYGEWTLTTQPTETATGEATRTCTECGEAETVTVAALSDTTVWTASTTAATHTEDGKTVYTSDYGTVEIKLPKLADNHVFDKQVVDAKYLKSEATCTEAAVYYKSCACGESSKEHGGETFTTGEALGHDFEHGTEVAGSRKAATCIAEGEYKVKCSRCDEVKTITLDIDSNAHDWDEGTITTPATCSAKGVKTFTCKHDGTHTKTEDVAIDPTAHTFNQEVTDTKYLKSAAVCTEKAVYYKSCVCGESSKEHGGETFTTGEALGHDFEHGTEVAGSRKAATCIAEGEYKVKCSRCDEVKTITLAIDPNAHDWDEGTITTPATCSAEGVKTFTCKHDSNHTKTESVAIDPDAHDWNEGVITTPATCSATGVKTYTCAHNSNHTRTETVPVDPNAHKAEADWTIDTPATCTQNGSKSHHCEYCDAKLDNEVIPATGHDEYQFVSWETEPTETAAGVANVKCGKCNAELTQEVAALTDPMWTKTETPATYDAAGNKAYTAMVFGSEQTINVEIPRLLAPYEGKTYQLVSFGNANGNINGKYFKDPDNDSVSYYITHSFVVGDVDEAGLSTDTFNRINAEYYTDGKVQFSGYDASTGKFNVTFTYKEKVSSGYDGDYGWSTEELVDKEETTWGCVSDNGSALYIYKGGSSSSVASHYFAVEGTEQIAVSGTQAQAASLLLDGKKAVCLQLGSTMFFVDENNVVFGATLADLEGKALTIANYTDSSVVIVNDASGNKVGAFARVVSTSGKADYVACDDGYEGIYTDGLGEQAYINGVGGITVKGFGYELVGTYAKVEGSDNEFDVLLDNGGMEYYLVTVTGNTYTKTKVMTTINYDLDGGTLPDGKTSDSVNIKVEFPLPTPTKEGYKFLGWYTTPTFDEYTRVETITLEQAEGDHTYYALFAAPAKVTFYNLDDGSNSGEILVNVGESILAAMPGYVINETKSKDGTKLFVGWYYVDGEDESLLVEGEDLVLLEESGSSISIRAKWAPLKTLTLVYGHGIDNKTLYMGDGDNIAELIATANANIKYNAGRPFVAWYIDTNGNGIVDAEEALLTESDVCSGNLTLVAKWNEDVNWEIKLGSGSNYPFVYDSESGTWKSSNNGSGYATSHAQLEIIAKSGTPLEVEFELTFVKTGSDELYFRYYKDGKRESETIKDSITSRKFVGIICKTSDGTEQHVQIDFKKSMLNSASFVALTNLTINGVAITTPNSPDYKDGTYTNETLGNLVINGFGAGTINGEALTYTIAAKDAGYTLLAKTANKTYKVTLNGSTYTAEEWNVTVSFNLGVEGQTKDSATLAYGTTYQLTEEIAPTIDGYTFRGWYSEAGFGNEITSVELTTDVTVYAKYDPAVTLTFDYNGQGTENVVINDKFKGDTIGNVIPDASELTKDGQSFVGWFLKDGENWGEKATADTILQNSVTYYAKWAEAHAMAGSYAAGANLDPVDNGIVKEEDTLSASSYKFEVDVEGNVTGWKAGKIVDFDATSGVFYLDVKNSKYYGGFNAEAKVMYVEYNPKSSAYHDIAFAAGSFGEVTPTATYNNAWDKGITKLVRITYSDGSVKYVFIRDRVVYTVSEESIVAKDNSGAAVTFEKIYSDASTLTFVAKNNGQVETTFSFERSGDNFILLDGLQGEYSGVETLTIDGHGGFTMGEQTGTYTIADAGSGYTLLAKTTSAAYKITLNGTAYTAEEYTVTVSFNFGDFAEEAGTFADQVVPFGVKTTLNVAPNIAGYKFKGWYDNAAFDGNVYEEVTITENKTFYAKYEILVEVKFDFSGYEYEVGQTVKVIDTLAVNDTLGDTIPTVPSDATLDGKVFDGWFVKNGEEWGDKISSTTKITEAVTFYAKWINAHELYGSYVGFETWSTGNGNLTNGKTATIDTKGNVSKADRISGQQINYNAETGAVSAGSYTGYYSAQYKILIYNYNTGNVATNDIYVFFKDVKSITASKNSQYSWNTGLNKLIDVTVENLDGTKESFAVYYADGKIQKCTWTADEGITTVAGLYNGGLKTNTLNIFDLDGNAIASFGKVGSDLQPLDGNQGTYTLTDSFTIVVDGHGGVVCDSDASVAYTVLENGNLTFAKAGTRTVVVSLDKANGTYAFVADGYAGTYTLPDNTTIEFFGNGTAENGKTYVVDGTNVTIFENGVGTKYKADFQAKTLEEPGFSFAGKRFQKDMYSYIVFDNTESISGKLYFETEEGSADITFKNATFDGSVLTIVVAGGSQSYYYNKGKTVEFEYADGKLTLKSKAGLNESWLNVGAVLVLK